MVKLNDVKFELNSGLFVRVFFFSTVNFIYSEHPPQYNTWRSVLVCDIDQKNVINFFSFILPVADMRL